MTPQCTHGQLRRTCDLCELTQALETAKDELQAARTCLTFFASCIKSGERWTEHCETAMCVAMGEPK
jgi:hypothetical protein